MGMFTSLAEEATTNVAAKEIGGTVEKICVRAKKDISSVSFSVSQQDLCDFFSKKPYIKFASEAS